MTQLDATAEIRSIMDDAACVSEIDQNVAFNKTRIDIEIIGDVILKGI